MMDMMMMVMNKASHYYRQGMRKHETTIKETFTKGAERSKSYGREGLGRDETKVPFAEGRKDIEGCSDGDGDG